MTDNIIMLTDGYKPSHWKMDPPGTEFKQYYFESRGGEFKDVVFFGLQPRLQKLTRRVTLGQVADAYQFYRNYFGRGDVFNSRGWNHIVSDHHGLLPVRIRAIPEGTVCKQGQPMFTVENTCPHCAWLPGYLEPFLEQTWYPTTIASLARSVYTTLAFYSDVTGWGPENARYMLHDFGLRGAPSVDAAQWAGAAHMLYFEGSDTIPALRFVQAAYNHPDMPAISVPASEHAIMTMWPPEDEVESFKDLLNVYPEGILSVVVDSNDQHYAVHQFATDPELRHRVLGRQGTVVLRLDSGIAVREIVGALSNLALDYGTITNAKGFKVLPPQIRLLWGDGLRRGDIEALCVALANQKWSLENIATFGMGGGLHMDVNRDTNKFAMKCSWAVVNGEARDVFKRTPGKQSKAGKQSYGLPTVFENGLLGHPQTFSEIRARAREGMPYGA